MNQRVIIQRYGGPEVLGVVEEPVPVPGPGDVLVRVLAAGTSFNEVMQSEGVYNNPALKLPKPPYSPGYDIYGVVERTGGGVPRQLTGLKVLVMTGIGGYSRYVCVSANQLTVVPEDDELDPAEAVCLPLNYLTAYQMLHRMAKVKPGQTILVQGAAGGVGSALADLGRAAGLRVIGTASVRKHALVRSYGAIPIDYRTQDVAKELRKMIPGGMDAAFDCFGGTIARQSYRMLKRGGRLILFGDMGKMQGGRPGSWLKKLDTFSGIVAALGQNLLFWRKKSVAFYGVGIMKNSHPEWYAEDLAMLMGLLAQRKIKPAVACRLPLNEARRAHEMLVSGEVAGRIVLIPE